MIIIKAKDYDEMSKKAATILLHELMLDPSLTLGLATGSTVEGLYAELINAHKTLNQDFSKVTTFNLDEYYPISKDNSQSYWNFMHEKLFNHININKDKINILDGSAQDPDLECDNYEKKIRNQGIDIQLLGIGANGHIAFNEPGSSFNSATRVVKLDDKTISDNARFFSSPKDVPKKALTMGISTIMSAKKIILLASGQNKAQAIKKMIEGPITDTCPASILQKHSDVIVILDEAATSLLEDDTLPKEISGYRIVSDKNFPKNKKIIVVSPHPDDSCIGPGATMAMLSEKNTLHTFVMTTGHRAFIMDTSKEERIHIREMEVVEESRILGAIPHFLMLDFYDSKDVSDKDVNKVYQYITTINPDIVMLPQKNDTHSTHQLSRSIILKALEKYGRDVELWNYESPWGLFNKGEFNTIVSIPENYMHTKILAIHAHKSQTDRTSYDIAAESLAKLRGALIPEQELAGFGNKRIRTHSSLEIFYVEKFGNSKDLKN